MQTKQLLLIAMLATCVLSSQIPSAQVRAQTATTAEASSSARADSPAPLFAAEFYAARELADDANILEIEQRIDGAIKSARQTFEKREKELGAEAPAVGESLLTLGILYTVNRDFVKAEKALKRARTIYEKAYGVDDVRYSYVLAALATWELDQGIKDKVENHLKQTLAIREKALGPDDLTVDEAAFQLAEYYQNKRDYTQAKALYDRVLATREKQLPADDARINQVWGRQACLLRKQDHRKEAAELEYRIGFGPKPEYEKNGKYKKPDRDSMDEKVRKWGRMQIAPSLSARMKSEYLLLAVALDPTGKAVYVCSQEPEGDPSYVYLVERTIYRSAFKTTLEDGVPVMVNGYISFFAFGNAPKPTASNPF